MYSELLFLYAFCLGGMRIKYGSKYIQDMSTFETTKRPTYFNDYTEGDKVFINHDKTEYIIAKRNVTYNLRKEGEK